MSIIQITIDTSGRRFSGLTCKAQVGVEIGYLLKCVADCFEDGELSDDGRKVLHDATDINVEVDG